MPNGAELLAAIQAEGEALALGVSSPLGSVRGRKPALCKMKLLGTLSAEDLRELEQPADADVVEIKRLRDRHHSIARLLALGYPAVQISAITTTSQSRISVLQQSPAFQELLAHYRSEGAKEFRDLRERFSQLGLEVTEELLARMEEEPESIPVGELREILKLVADRSGHGPTSKNITLSGTIDASTMERIRNATQNKETIIEAGAKDTDFTVCGDEGRGAVPSTETSGSR